MPIRFRCVYCDKLLGIATRKAGAVVNCPQCAQPLIVPTPEPGPEPAAAPTPPAPAPPHVQIPDANLVKPFEQDDFDVLLEPEPPTLRGPHAGPPSVGAPSTLPIHAQPFAVERNLPRAPIPMPVPQPHQRSRGIVLSSGMLILAIILVVILIGIAFGGGFLVARMMNQSA